MARYFNLAHGIKPIEFSGDFAPYPYDIDICFELVPHPIAFSEGVCHSAVGCAVSAKEALEPKWKELFEITKSSWLIPYIERLAQGEPLPMQKIFDHFESINGKPPDSYESKFS